jgi:hypothetical protein
MQKTQMEKTIREILKKAGLESAFDKSGEFHLKVENKSYMELVIERHGQRVSVAHYFQQNGDAMRDPEIEFILATWLPVWIQQDPVGIFTVAISFSDDGKPRIHKTMLADLTRFAAKWARNIKAQKFAERGTFTSLTHAAELRPRVAPDAHLEAMYEELSQTDDETEPYEPSPYDGTFGEE